MKYMEELKIWKNGRVEEWNNAFSLQACGNRKANNYCEGRCFNIFQHSIIPCLQQASFQFPNTIYSSENYEPSYHI